MTPIITNPDYADAAAQLLELRHALSMARNNENALLEQLRTSETATSALERAKAMLTGKTPAPRQDRDGLALRLSECRERIALLELAIAEQEQVVAALVLAQSTVVNAANRPAHIKAVERIKSALSALRDAVDAEQAVRTEIAEQGYKCTLPAMAHPELSFADSHSAVGRFSKDVDMFLLTHQMAEAKTANVRMLVNTDVHRAGDVVAMSGADAAALVTVGHAEQTTAKPGRIARAREVVETIYS